MDIPLLKKHPWTIFVLIVFGIYMFKLLQPNLHEMVLPVIVYLIAILSMFAAALDRYKKVSDASFYRIAFGGLFFIISDSILALNKFYERIEYAHLYTMATYMAAQYLIVTGAVKQIREAIGLSSKTI